MLNPYILEKIENWVSDFTGSARHAALPHAAQEYASEVLVRFLTRACETAELDPGALSQKAVRSGLVEGVAKLKLPESVKPEVPQLCRAFLEELEDAGRLGSGADLGRYVGALSTAYLEATADRPKPIVSHTSKIGRNDPCPCGSGKKYKKCCQNLLGND